MTQAKGRGHVLKRPLTLPKIAKKMLGMQAVQAEFAADYTPDNVLGGIIGAAEAGRPHAQVCYGYRRVYDSRTKALLRQEPDDEPRIAISADGGRSSYPAAGIVVEVVTRLGEGATVTAVVWDLNARGCPRRRVGHGRGRWCGRWRCIRSGQARNPLGELLAVHRDTPSQVPSAR